MKLNDNEKGNEVDSDKIEKSDKYDCDGGCEN